jgi:DNA-binding NarL/FixJ family response regulator
MPPAGPLTVVIADDIPLDRHLVRFLLQEEGFEVVGESSGGAEAARLVAEHRPDAVVLHGNLTIEGGSHVIQWIRLTSPWTKIVLLTPHPDEASVAWPEYRADADLEEGFGLKDLVAALRSLCRPPVPALDVLEEAAGEKQEGLEGRLVGRRPAAAVRVVLGEAAGTHSGPLRSVLEHEGFDIVGQASNPDELERVLAAEEPTAIVLDANVGAMAVLAARGKLPDAGIVVVWPPGILAPVADEQVEPSRVYQDLGRAVRRVARLALLRERATAPTGIEAPARIPAAVARMRRREPAPEPIATSPVSEGIRRGGVIVLIAAASLIVLMVAALALTMPDRLGMVAKSRSPSPSKSVVAPSPKGGGDTGTKGCGGPSHPIANEAPLGNHGHHDDHGSQGNQGHHVQRGHHGAGCKPHGDHGHQGPRGSKGNHANHANHANHGNGGGHGHHGHPGLPSHSKRPTHGGHHGSGGPGGEAQLPSV